jgi:hypothetical protein
VFSLCGIYVFAQYINVISTDHVLKPGREHRKLFVWASEIRPVEETVLPLLCLFGHGGDDKCYDVES